MHSAIADFWENLMGIANKVLSFPCKVHPCINRLGALQGKDGNSALKSIFRVSSRKVLCV